MKNRKNKTGLIPSSLYEAISNLNLTQVHRDNSIHFCELIIRRQAKNNLTLNHGVQMPKEYLRTVFTSRYSEWLNVLISNNIVNRQDSYSTITKQSKRYSVNGEFMSDDLVKVKYSVIEKRDKKQIMKDNCKINLKNEVIEKGNNNNYLSITSYLSNSSPLYHIFGYNFKQLIEKKLPKTAIRECMSSLSIDFERGKKVIKNKVEDISLNSFIHDDMIDPNSFIRYSYGLNSKVYTSKASKAIADAKSNGWNLIKVDNDYLIIDAEDFIDMKKAMTSLSYKDSLMRMNKQFFYANRNNTNYRLDTNLTNISGVLCDMICEDNELLSIDLSNSQFALLSWLLSAELDTEDFKRFKELSATGMLYDYLQEKLSLSTRKEAKTMCFELLFSKESNKSNNMKVVKELFPSVVDWINNFKKEHGYKNFAVMLQQVESILFIDILYKVLLDRFGFCLTKHDSFIVKESDAEDVYDTICKFFSTIGLEANLTIG